MDKSIMWKYIYEEENVLQELIKSKQVAEFASDCDLSKIERILFLASGSSLNIAKVSSRLYEEVSDTSVNISTPYNYLGSPAHIDGQKNNTLVIAISQTGTSSNTVNAIKKAKEQGLKVLSITETRDTPVQKLGDYYLNFLCGSENCNAKTKGYSNSLVLLWQIALEIGRAKGVLEDDTYNRYREEIENSIKDIPETIKETLKWLEANKDWSTVNHLLVVGYGMNYGTAEEGSLKLMETLCRPTSVCEVGEFAHGVHRAIGKESNVITILTEEYGYEDMLKINNYLEGRIRRLLVINASQKKYDTNTYINVAYRPLTASALNIAVVFQLMSVYLPEVNGNDPNAPSNDELTKILTIRV